MIYNNHLGRRKLKTISRKTLYCYQQQTFRLKAENRLRNPQQAVEFVNERGFIFFWPVKGTHFPSLWGAVAGDRPVADKHNDPGHVSWGWKDSMLDKHVWYYARILKKKNTFVSLETIPYFYALSPNYGEPEVDLQDQYDQGLLPQEAKLVFDALVRRGPLDTISLRKESHLSGSTSQAPFNHALEILQQQLKVLPVAISEAGAWKYAFVYDLTHRYYPDLIDRSREISEPAAMQHLLMLYAQTMGAFQVKQAVSLFKWEINQVERVLKHLLEAKIVVDDVSILTEPGVYYSLPVLLD